MSHHRVLAPPKHHTVPPPQFIRFDLRTGNLPTNRILIFCSLVELVRMHMAMIHGCPAMTLVVSRFVRLRFWLQPNQLCQRRYLSLAPRLPKPLVALRGVTVAVSVRERNQQTFQTVRWHQSSYSTSAFPLSSSPGLGTVEPSGKLQAPGHLDDKERHVFDKLAVAFEPSMLEVQDVSGGCGSMYAIEICSSRFKGLTTLKQHRQVQDVLREEIKGWHGLQLKTKSE